MIINDELKWMGKRLSCLALRWAYVPYDDDDDDDKAGRFYSRNQYCLCLNTDSLRYAIYNT
jgi:hypothetical protein